AVVAYLTTGLSLICGPAGLRIILQRSGERRCRVLALPIFPRHGMTWRITLELNMPSRKNGLGEALFFWKRGPSASTGSSWREITPAGEVWIMSRLRHRLDRPSRLIFRLPLSAPAS